MKTLLLITLSLLLDGIIPAGDAFLRPLQKRDSILVADRLEYGFELKGVEDGTGFLLPDFTPLQNDTLTLVQGWKIDTLKRFKRSGTIDMRASITVAPFEEGTYHMPDLLAIRQQKDSTDTLCFKGLEFKVVEFPIDSARVARNELLPIMTYPLTFGEVLPFLAGALVLAALIFLLVRFLRKKGRAGAEAKPRDPAHVVALRELDRYRDRKFWAPEKQKTFYSGVTDALKAYIDERFAIDAPEMTTAELFSALKGNGDLTPELYGEMKSMFETADFVKFAKYTAPDEDNAKVLPTAVRFVTSTYEAQVQEQAQDAEKGGEA